MSSASHITFVRHDGERTTVAATHGRTVMQAALDHSIDGIVAECGGNCLCGTCHVYVAETGRLAAIGEDEEDILDFAAAARESTSRLSCQLVVTRELDGLVVEIPRYQV